MQNLKRNKNMGFRVTQEEYDEIKEVMSRKNFSSIRAFLLKMALNGYIVNIDLSEVNEMSRILRNVGNNLNQIAKKMNETGRTYDFDLTGIQEQLGEIWKRQDKLISCFAKELEN